MASNLLELAYWCQLDSLLNILGLTSTTDTQCTSNRLQLLSDPADLVFKNPTNSACWNFQYKAFIKPCAKMCFIKSFWSDNLVVVTLIYKKTWYHQTPCLVKISNSLSSSLYSNVFVHCKCGLLAAKIIFILVFCPFYGNYLYLAFTFLKKHGIASLF